MTKRKILAGLCLVLTGTVITLISAAASVSAGEKEIEDVFGIFEGHYLFTSGAGGWATEMEISGDGTFYGEFHDSDMGASGEGYDSTLYYSKFSGTFTNPQKVNAYTYSFELDSIQYENIPDSEEIKTEGSDRIRVVYSEVYGLEPGLIYAYTASAPVSTLPEGLMSWINMLLGEESNDKEILSANSLFVVEPEYGWIEHQPTGYWSN